MSQSSEIIANLNCVWNENFREDDKYSRRHRFDGPVTEFKEKEGYKPTPKLEYIDDSGKVLNIKEAFRYDPNIVKK